MVEGHIVEGHGIECLEGHMEDGHMVDVLVEEGYMGKGHF
jgi:hypothetical protein